MALNTRRLRKAPGGPIAGSGEGEQLSGRLAKLEAESKRSGGFQAARMSRRPGGCAAPPRVPFCTVLAPLYCDSSRGNATVCYDLPKGHFGRKLCSAKDLFAFRRRWM